MIIWGDLSCMIVGFGGNNEGYLGLA